LVVTKTMVEFDHEGTEAASVGTAPKSRVAAAPSMPDTARVPEFKCNRPYYFAIRERSSGLTLVSGRVENPLLTSATPVTRSFFGINAGIGLNFGNGGVGLEGGVGIGGVGVGAKVGITAGKGGIGIGAGLGFTG